MKHLILIFVLFCAGCETSSPMLAVARAKKPPGPTPHDRVIELGPGEAIWLHVIDCNDGFRHMWFVECERR